MLEIKDLYSQGKKERGVKMVRREEEFSGSKE